MEIITPEEFAERMQYISENTKMYTDKSRDDVEAMHCCMDNLMVETLESLGYTKGLKIFENTPKWYA